MNPLNPEEFRRQGHMVIDFLADYYKNIEQYPVRSQVQPGYLLERLPDCAPLHPESIETILKDVHREIIPGITHWQSPSFFAYFASSGSTASFVGEMLLNGFNVVGFNWLSSPAATELETLVIEWLSKLLQLPKSFSSSSNSGGGGVLQGTTCEAFVCTLLAAREKMLDQIGRENTTKLVVYCSDQTHCSLQKAAKIVGIDPENIRQVLTTKSTNFQLSAESLDELIKKDVEVGLVPMYLCATVGTTSTTAVDPLGPLCEMASTYNLWVHVDAAYAGSACICPEFRHFLDGVEGASSFSFNAHKWLLTNLACCCLWVKDTLTLTKSLSTNPEYLNNKATESRQVVDFKDWQIALTRRFQALKLWMVLRSYGTTGLRAFIRNHVKMAKDFEGMVSMDNRFEIIVPTNFSMVCFRVSPFAISQQGHNHREANGNVISQHGDNDREVDGTVISQQGDNDHEANGTVISKNGDNDNEANGTAISQNGDNDYKANGITINQNGYNGHEANGTAISQHGDNDHEANEFNMKLLESINETGCVYMTHSIVGRIYFIRFAVGATLTEDRHVQMAWELVQDQATSLLHTRTPKSIW